MSLLRAISRVIRYFPLMTSTKASSPFCLTPRPPSLIRLVPRQGRRREKPSPRPSANFGRGRNRALPLPCERSERIREGGRGVRPRFYYTPSAPGNAPVTSAPEEFAKARTGLLVRRRRRDSRISGKSGPVQRRDGRRRVVTEK